MEPAENTLRQRQPGDRQDELLDPAADAAIRAFFVHPQWTRRGIATAILEACEQAGCAAGFRRFEMTATLTGLRMYLARGYGEVERTLIPLPNGVSFPVVKLGKTIPSVEG
jgi:GNAT superfamily N-acetyltransferase